MVPPLTFRPSFKCIDRGGVQARRGGGASRYFRFRSLSVSVHATAFLSIITFVALGFIVSRKRHTMVYVWETLVLYKYISMFGIGTSVENFQRNLHHE